MNGTRHGSRITMHDRALRATASKQTTAQTPPPPRRPNGRTAACDPCRLRKLACDHKQPVCGRCARSRGTDNSCTYTASSSGGRAPLLKTTSSPIAVSRPGSSGTGANDTEVLTKDDGSTSVEFNCLPPRSSASGFYSHNAALEEIRTNLLFPVAEQSPQNDGNNSQESSSVRFSQLPTVVREKSLFVLKTVFNLIDSQVGERAGQQCTYGWVHLAVQDIFQSLQNLMRPFKNGSKQQGLEHIAERIFTATKKPFQDHELNARKWLHQFCGANLRWESLGLIWPYLERITDPVDYFSKPLIKWTDGVTGDVARTCLDYCIQLAKFCGEPHNLLLHLCWYRTIMDSVLDGDGSEYYQATVFCALR